MKGDVLCAVGGLAASLASLDASNILPGVLRTENVSRHGPVSSHGGWGRGGQGTQLAPLEKAQI